MKKMLILGAGFAGLAMETELEGIARSGAAEVALVDRSTHFSMGFSMQWSMIGRRNQEEGFRPYSSLQAPHVKFVNDEVVSIDTGPKTVNTKSQKLAYDYLVIALGAELCPGIIPGLSEGAYNLCDRNSVMQLKAAVANIQEGTIAVVISSVPFKCPPAPYEYALLIDDMLRKRNVRNKIRIILTTPEPQPMPVAGKEIGETVKSLLAQRGIEYITLHKPKIVDAVKSKIFYENGFEISYDILCAMPPHRAPKAARDSGICDESGFVPAELGSFATRMQGVYAIGDAASIKLPNGSPHPKAGVFAEAQAITLARNLIAEISKGEKEKYDGKGVCYIDTGMEKAAPAEIQLLAAGGPKASLGEPSHEGIEGKRMFEAERLRKWFGDTL